jgi:hypothetical protein
MECSFTYHEPERTRKETVVADCRYSPLLAPFDLQEAATPPTSHASENSRFTVLGTNLVPSEYATSDLDVQELVIRKSSCKTSNLRFTCSGHRIFRVLTDLIGQ